MTICIADRMPRFGDVVDGIVQLNDAGMMIENHWRSLPGRFGHVDLDAFVIMPNHLHGILRINASSTSGEETLSSVIQAFKSLTTRAYAEDVRAGHWPAFDRRLWQQSFYDHVVRDEGDLERIRAYIASNPGRWFEDREYRAWQETLTRRPAPSGETGPH